MNEFEAISGVFIDKNKVLLLRRNPRRTYFRGLWDLMGGDINEDETPLEALRRDAKNKLHIPVASIIKQGSILVDEGATKPIRRHYFVCTGNYSQLTIDTNKYDQSAWYSPKEIGNYSLCPNVLPVLKAAFSKEV